MKIEFNIPPFIGTELVNIRKTIDNKKIAGDGEFTKKCSRWMEKKFQAKKVLLTTSCTDALEMAALLTEVHAEDEVIAASYTFVSTVLPFVTRGAKIVFVDIDPDTMNIDIDEIERAVTPKTKVICITHYAGVACDMDRIMSIANQHNILVVEDAAQGFMSKYKDKYLGTIGHLGCYSFHETKNYSSGEGGAIVVNDDKLLLRAEIIREKGTNRSLFHKGLVDKYTWHDIGSSFLMSDINAAYLWSQLEVADKINDARRMIYDKYYESLSDIKEIELQVIPEFAVHNSHMFYIKLQNEAVRNNLIEYLKEHGVSAVFHYIPLHTSPAGLKFTRFSGEDRYTTKESERLVRLPLYYGLSLEEVEYVCGKICKFFNQ